MGSQVKMRTVATFNNPAEAHLLAAHLGGSGIDVVLRDENTVQADLLLTHAIGGVKVDVADADFDKAMAVVRSFSAPTRPATGRMEKRTHGAKRYFKIMAFLFPTIFVLAEWLVGWIAHGTVFGCSAVIAGGISAFLALFDL